MKKKRQGKSKNFTHAPVPLSGTVRGSAPRNPENKGAAGVNPRGFTTGFDVITLGTATLDVVMHVVASLHRVVKIIASGDMQCFPLGSKVEVQSSNMHIGPGGGATNAAVTFSRQGFKTACIAEVGKDIFGALIVEHMRKEKIQPFFSVNTQLPTALSMVVVHREGERTVFVHRGASANLSYSEIPFADIEAKWVYCAPGGMPHRMVDRALEHFHRNGLRVALNPSKRQLKLGIKKLKPLLDMVDVLVLNQEEASYLTGISQENEQKIFKTLDKAVKGIVVMTRGPKGLAVSDGKHVWTAGIYKNKRIMDRLGAGDALGSGFVAGLMRSRMVGAPFSDAAIKRAIRLGSANATSEVEQLGTQTGILTQKQFETQARWGKLKITRTDA